MEQNKFKNDAIDVFYNDESVNSLARCNTYICT